MTEDELRSARSRHGARVAEADVAATDDGEAESSGPLRGGDVSGDAHARSRLGHDGPGGEGTLADTHRRRQAPPVELRRRDCAFTEPAIQVPDLPRIGCVPDEIGHVEPPGGERVQIRRGEQLKRVVCRGSGLDGQSADVGPDEAQPLALNLGEGRGGGEPARRSEQHDGRAGSRCGNRRDKPFRIAGGFDHDRRVRLTHLVGDAEARCSQPQRGCLGPARSRHHGDRPRIAEHQEAVSERADRTRPHDADGHARLDACAKDAVAGDDGEIHKGRGLREHSVRNRRNPSGGHGRDGGVRKPAHGHERPGGGVAGASTGCEHPAGARVTRGERQARLGVREPEPLRPLGPGAHGRDQHLNRRLVRTREQSLDRQDLRVPGPGDDHLDARDNPPPASNRACPQPRPVQGCGSRQRQIDFPVSGCSKATVQGFSDGDSDTRGHPPEDRVVRSPPLESSRSAPRSCSSGPPSGRHSCAPTPGSTRQSRRAYWQRPRSPR